MRLPRVPRMTDIRGSRAARWAARGGIALVVASFGYSLVVSPVREWFVQRSAIASKTKEFEALAEANEQLQKEVDELSTPEGIRQAARTHLGYVLPGEKRIVISEIPALPTDLPLAWPYTMVTQMVNVRTADSSHGGAGLAPLAP